MRRKILNSAPTAAVLILVTVPSATSAGLSIGAGARLCPEGNYVVTGGGVSRLQGSHCNVQCGSQVSLGGKFTPGVSYGVTFTVAWPGAKIKSAAVDVSNVPCGYSTSGFACDTPLDALEHTMSISIQPTNIVFGLDSCKSHGRYKLPADGQSQTTPYVNDTAAGSLTWSIDGQTLDASINPSSGVVTAGKRSGTIKIHAQNASGSFCYDENIDLEEAEFGCAGGNCGGAMGVPRAALGSVDVLIPLGWSITGGTAGYLQIKEDQPFAATASKLRYDFIKGDADVIRESGVLRQVKVPYGLANITNNTAYKFTIAFYHPTNIGTISSTVYQLSNSPFATITVENPNDDTDKLRVVHTQEGLNTTNDYTKITDGWELISGNGLRKETQTTLWSETNTLRTVTTTIKPGSGSTVIFQKIEKYRTNSTYQWERLEQEIIGTGQYPLTNTYTWLTSGYLQQVVRSDGSWQYFEYDSQNRPTKVFSSFKSQGVTQDTNLCRVLEHDYSTNVISGAGDNGNLDTTTPRRTIERWLGIEVGRSYYVALRGERRQIRCVTPGALWNASDNLVTTNRYFTNGFYQNELSAVLRPDGTGDIYRYGKVEVRATNFNTTNFVLIGHVDATGTSIDAGVTNELVYDWVGLLVSKRIIDCPSGITVAKETYQYDGLKRLTNTTFLDGTFIARTYSECCGTSTETDQEGTVTSFTYDGLKRLLTSTKNGITRSNVYDAHGNALALWRFPTSGSAITLSEATYDDAGRMTTSKDALSNTTVFTNYLDASGQVVKKTSYPDTGTRIETYFKDRSLQSLTGTAVHGLSYDYGVESENGTQRSFTKQTKLNTGGSATDEWTKTYFDMAGRTYKVLHSDNAASQMFYNSVGQVSKTVDPDGVTTLFQYDSLGEVEYTAIDMDRDSIVDFNGTDRITRTTSDVLYNGTIGANVRRARTFVWSTDNSAASNLLTTVESSVEGLTNWNTLWNAGVAVVSSTKIAYTGGHRYVTQTAADGSYTVSDFQSGRLLSVTNKDSGGTSIGWTTNTFDAHGRLATATDARNGATTYAYNNADLQTSVTTPAPGSGQSAQTTSTAYDNMLRVSRVTYPDNTSITNTYSLTGLVSTNFGSRRYAVAYTHDYAGRTNTMMTWTDFASRQGATVTTFTYNERGFLTNKVYADGKGPTYSYTLGGREKMRTWARGVSATNSFNAAGEISSMTYSDSTPAVTVVYDRRGRPSSVTQGTNITSLAWNDASHLLSETVNGLSVSNIYNSLLLRSNLQFRISGSSQLNHLFSYDEASRLQSVSDGTNSAEYVYVANSSLISAITNKQSGAARVTAVKSWDFVNRLIEISSAPSADSVVKFGHAYNLANQRTSITNADLSRRVYEYDFLGQVTFAKRYWPDGTIVAGQQFEYGYDDIGNRKFAASGGNEWGTALREGKYTANSLNQYAQRAVPAKAGIVGTATNTAIVTVNDHPTLRKAEYFSGEVPVNNATAAIYQSITNLGVLNNGTNSDVVTNITGNLFFPKTPELFTYDFDGNLTSDGRWTNRWDAENRLVLMESLATTPSASWQKLLFTYDSLWRRTSKIVSNWSGTTWTQALHLRFVYDRWNLISELDASNNVVRSYQSGTDLSGTFQGAGGVAGLISMRIHSGPNAGTYFYLYDANGNVAALISATDGKSVAQYEYDPFGQLLRATGPVAFLNPFRFSTKYHDDETGLLYYGFRYCDPLHGRWLSRDPIGEVGGMNLFCLLQNDAANRTDSLGLRPVSITINIGPNLNLTPAVMTEINRILQDCVQSCVACDKKGKAKHQITLNWKSVKEKPRNLGFQGGVLNFNPTGYAVYIEGSTQESVSVLGRTAGDSVYIGLREIIRQSDRKRLDPEMVLATTIAHEVFHHAIGGTTGHFSSAGFVDSTTGQINGKLSPQACKELCDELDID